MVRASGGLFRSECPFCVTLGTTLYAGFPVEWIPGIEEVPGRIETIPSFGPAYQPFGRLNLTTFHPCLRFRCP
jgi:hypothetical protein